MKSTSTSSADFKQAIRAGNIQEAFLVAMSNAPELNITTRIVTADDSQNQLRDSQTQGDNSLHTHISLIEGKVENEIGEQLTGDRYTEIKQFHIEQVTKGHQTIQHNLLSLQKMFQLMSAFQEQQTAEQSNWVDIAADIAREPLPSQPRANQLSGQQIQDAIAPGTAQKQPHTSAFRPDSTVDSSEPQLPFVRGEEDDELVDDLMSLTDLDDVETDEADQSNQSSPQTKQGDWGDWLEEDEEGAEVKPEVFNLKSLNIGQASQNWQNWESEAHSNDSNPNSED